MSILVLEHGSHAWAPSLNGALDLFEPIAESDSSFLSA